MGGKNRWIKVNEVRFFPPLILPLNTYHFIDFFNVLYFLVILYFPVFLEPSNDMKLLSFNKIIFLSTVLKGILYFLEKDRLKKGFMTI